MTAQRSRRGAGSRVLGWLLLLALPASVRAQPEGALTVLSREALRSTGRSELAEALQALLPSFNVPRPSVAGASDHVRGAAFRGLNADQVLVLVNGRRRHPSALLNVDATIGRGQGMVDLNAIPLSAVERVEVRTGASSARYGLDAAAGVINIVLLSDGPDELGAELGTTTAGDGRVLLAGGNHRLGLGRDGFVQLAAELRSRGATNRAGPDPRPQYFPGDPRNTDPAFGNRVDHRFGDPETNQVAGFLNAAKRLRGNLEAYGFAGWSYRSSTAGERWRTAADDRTVRVLYPNGFLPLIAPKLQDGSAVAGLRGSILGWSWDASVGYARNTVRYELDQTANASLGAASPTEFHAGTLRADQFTTQLQLARRIIPGGMLPPLLLELGGSQRSDGYQIEAGEPDSYRYGAVPILDGPHAGQIAPIGAQGFNAFRPEEAVIARRGILGASGALSTVVFRRLALAAEGRLEYSRELGRMDVYALRGELAPVHGIGLRGSYGTGVRIPSLAQSLFSSTSTRVVGQSGFDDRTVPVNSPLAGLLGARSLRPERSRELGIGAVLTRVKGLTLSADYYRIRVRHRIILSGTFQDAAILSYLAQNGFPGISGVRFFANALATRTTGVDASASYRFGMRSVAVQLSAALNHHSTSAVLTDSVTGPLAPFNRVFFDRTEQARYELGQPKNTLLVSAQATRGRWTANARTQRFDTVASYGQPTDGALDQVYRAKWIADLGLSYRYRQRLTLTLGADNLFNSYPDRNRFGDGDTEGNSNFGMFPYPNVSPFGFNGRMVYLRAGWR